MASDKSTRRRARIVALTTLLLTWAGLTVIASATHGDRTLDVVPENSSGQATFPQGGTVTLTAILSSPTTAAVNIDFENENGANDPGGGESNRTLPDLSCTINDPLTPEPSPTSGSSGGQAEDRCSISYPATNTGNATWRVWVDEDGLNSTEESDADEQAAGDDSNGVAAQPAAGSGDDCSDPTDPMPPLLEPDCTDVVQVRVVAPAATTQAKVDCDDTGSDADKERETNSPGANSSENYQCTVRDANNQVTEGTVYGEVENGINDPDGTDGESHDSPDYACAAGTNGRCDITVTQNEGELGTADICFWIPIDDGKDLCDSESLTEETAQDGSDSANDGADRVAKTWAAQSTGSPATGSPSSPRPSGSSTVQPTGAQTSVSPTRTRSPSTTRPPGRADRSVTLNASDDRVPAGRRVRLSGNVRSDESDCEQNQVVQIKRRKHGATTDEEIRLLTTDAQGAFTTSVRVRRNADYMAEVERTADCDFAASNAVTVLANTKIRGVKASDRTPERGSKVVVRARIVPPQDGTKAILKRKKGKRFVKFDVDRLNNRSRARFVFRARWIGKRVFRIFWYPGKQKDNERGRSAAFRLRSHR